MNIKEYFVIDMWKSLLARNKVFIATTVILSSLILIATILNIFFSFNSISEVRQLGDIDQVKITNQNFLLTFKRPMDNADVDSLITFEPDVEFQSQWNGRTLVIRINDSLNANSEYRLRIDADIKDIYGSSMKGDFEYRFKTSSVYYYALDNSSGDQSAVVRIDVNSGEQVEIYSGQDLLDFHIRLPYLVVISGDPNHSTAKLINLDTEDEKDILIAEKHVVDLMFHPTEMEIWALQQDVFKEGSVTVPLGNKQVMKYVVSEDKVSNVLFNTELQSVETFFISPGGTDILVQESFSNRFGIVDVDDPQVWSPLGKYAASLGYDRSGEALLFININWANLQDPTWISIRNSDGETVLSDKSKSSIDPAFIDESIIFSTEYQKLSTERSAYEIMVSDYSGVELNRIQKDGYSLEYPTVSLGGRYALVRGYELADLADPFTFEDRLNSIPAPYLFTPFLYDNLSGELSVESFETSVVRFEE